MINRSARMITAHMANELNRSLTVTADNRSEEFGKSSHHYQVTYATLVKTDENTYATDIKQIPIDFQEGPVKEHGINGITNEVLLAIVLDRLDGFQTSDFRCRENAIAITKIEEGLMWLQKRTRDREARGVEGTNNV